LKLVGPVKAQWAHRHRDTTMHTIVSVCSTLTCPRRDALVAVSINQSPVTVHWGGCFVVAFVDLFFPTWILARLGPWWSCQSMFVAMVDGLLGLNECLPRAPGVEYR
jgi:hypothetical protein